MLGKESYDAFPTHGIAIDTQFMLQGAQTQVSTVASVLKGLDTNSAKITQMVKHDGRECYEIVSTISPDVIAALGKTLTANVRKMLPAGNRFVIDKETFLMVEMVTLSEANTPIMKMEYKDIVVKPNLQDELFLLPVGLDVQKPKSMTEYAAILSEILQSKVQVPQPNTETLSEYVPKPRRPRRPRLGPVTIDLATGEAIPPLPVGMTRLEFNIRTDPPKPPLKMPPNHSWFRWGMILLPLCVVLTFLTVMRWKACRPAHMSTK